MATAIQEPPNQEFNGYRNTGFPEPLSLDRNTTLPYPTADTSPTAFIEASDIPVARATSRLSFSHSRRHRHKHSTVKGFLNPDHVDDSSLYAGSTKEAKDELLLTKDSSPDVDGSRDSKTSSEDRTPRELDEQGRSPSQKKVGLLKRVFHRD